jgi:CubicO group peptidase (beta-lactamase class C family)
MVLGTTSAVQINTRCSAYLRCRKRILSSFASLVAALLALVVPLAALCADSPSASIGKVDQILQTRKAPFPFSGVVLVSIGGKIALDKGYGFAEVELDVRNAPNLIYRIGSLSKPISAVAMMSLVEKHLVSLDDPVCRYIARCPGEWSPVLVRHLLSHTSGIPDLFNAVPAAPVHLTRDAIDKTIENAANRSLDSAPGTKHVYRNFNYMLVGYIIEVVSGKDWGDVLKSSVFDPAGMTDTAYDDVWTILPRRVRGYDVKDGVLRNTVYKDHSAFAPGGLRSTSADLLAFTNAFLSGKLLAPGTRQQMLTPVLSDYGFGWQIKQFFGHPMFNHTGGIDGFASHVAVYPGQQLVIVVLSNIESEPAKLTACKIASILLTPSHEPVDSCPDH